MGTGGGGGGPSPPPPNGHPPPPPPTRGKRGTERDEVEVGPSPSSSPPPTHANVCLLSLQKGAKKVEQKKKTFSLSLHLSGWMEGGESDFLDLPPPPFISIS